MLWKALYRWSRCDGAQSLRLATQSTSLYTREALYMSHNMLVDLLVVAEVKAFDKVVN